MNLSILVVYVRISILVIDIYYDSVHRDFFRKKVCTMYFKKNSKKVIMKSCLVKSYTYIMSDKISCIKVVCIIFVIFLKKSYRKNLRL